MVMIDDNLAGMSFGPKVEKALLDTNVKFERNAQLIPYMISFWRSVITISEGNDMKVDKWIKLVFLLNVNSKVLFSRRFYLI